MTILAIDHGKTPIRNPWEGRWELYDGDTLLFVGKTRNEIVALSHTFELQKIRRIKLLEAYYSRYQNTSLYKVNDWS